MSIANRFAYSPQTLKLTVLCFSLVHLSPAAMADTKPAPSNDSPKTQEQTASQNGQQALKAATGGQPTTAQPTTDTAKANAAAVDSGSKSVADAINESLTGGSGKLLVKPGQPIAITMEQEDLVPTDDVELAKKQVLAYPDSPEASFILAVALTRTSHVEEALQEVRRARRLADKQGGAEYFNKMISQYEKMLEYCPDENRVRYGLAWAYYMKAYLLGHAHPKAPAAPPAQTEATASPAAPAGTAAPAAADKKAKDSWANAQAANQVLAMLSPKLVKSAPEVPGAVASSTLPHIPSAIEQASPDAVPQIRQYYEAALKNLDDLLARNPKDVWAKVYRAHLYLEYTGDIEGAMKVWLQCEAESPNNPAAHFFLSTGYLKEGNLQKAFEHISKAIALRAVGN